MSGEVGLKQRTILYTHLDAAAWTALSAKLEALDERLYALDGQVNYQDCSVTFGGGDLYEDIGALRALLDILTPVALPADVTDLRSLRKHCR